METEIKINAVICADWKKYKALWLEALTNDPQAFGASYEERAARTDEEWQEKIKKSLIEKSKNGIFIAQDKDKFIGMIGFSEKRKNAANIYGVYVNPQYRGKKVSDMLMMSLLNSIKQAGFPEIELSVNKNQKAAVGFYKRHGFIIIEEINNVKMGNGTLCTEYLMNKKL